VSPFSSDSLSEPVIKAQVFVNQKAPHLPSPAELIRSKRNAKGVSGEVIFKYLK
jgi:hypothetical protein